MIDPQALLVTGVAQMVLEGAKIAAIGFLGGCGFWLAAKLLRAS